MKSGWRKPGRAASWVAEDRKSPPSSSSAVSIAPVGLEVREEETRVDPFQPPNEEAQRTGPYRLPMQRRRLGGVVVGTVAGCALILVAAAIARASHASNGPIAAGSLAMNHTSAMGREGNALVAPDHANPPAYPASPIAGSPPASKDANVSETPGTGTVRLVRPATAGHVWIDGKKLTSASALVDCGVHKVRIGARHARSITIPCGGEITISK